MKDQLLIRILTIVFCGGYAFSAHASSQNQLAQEMALAGASEFEGRRSDVEIKDCLLTLNKWREYPDVGWELAFSSQIDLSRVYLIEDTMVPGKKFGYVVLSEGLTEIGQANIGIRSSGGATIRNERPMRGYLPKDAELSPRGDGKSYFVMWTDEAVVLLQGSDVRAKAQSFVAAFESYRDRFCIRDN